MMSIYTVFTFSKETSSHFLPAGFISVTNRNAQPLPAFPTSSPRARSALTFPWQPLAAMCHDCIYRTQSSRMAPTLRRYGRNKELLFLVKQVHSKFSHHNMVCEIKREIRIFTLLLLFSCMATRNTQSQSTWL